MRRVIGSVVALVLGLPGIVCLLAGAYGALSGTAIFPGLVQAVVGYIFIRLAVGAWRWADGDERRRLPQVGRDAAGRFVRISDFDPEPEPQARPQIDPAFRFSPLPGTERPGESARGYPPLPAQRVSRAELKWSPRELAEEERRATWGNRRPNQDDLPPMVYVLRGPPPDYMHVDVVGEEYLNRNAREPSRIRLIKELWIGAPLRLIAEPQPMDRDAVMVCREDGQTIGFLPKAVACEVAPCLARGHGFHARVARLVNEDEGDFDVTAEVWLPTPEGVAQVRTLEVRTRPKGRMADRHYR